MTDIIEQRRSVRKFDPCKLVTKEQLDQLLEAAMLAPSACNSRPWEFIAVTKREILDKIAKGHPNAKMCATATAAIVILAVPKEGKPSGYFSQDCAAAAQNILLEAQAMGLGTCWCGVYPKNDKYKAITEIFDIKEPRIVFNVIAIGYPDEIPVKRGFFEESKVSYIM